MAAGAVWIDAWQMQRCGSLRGGDPGDWTVSNAVEREWLETLVGAEGTSVLQTVDVADGRVGDAASLRLSGYVVELEVDAAS
jgi:hypothetical protein